MYMHLLKPNTDNWIDYAEGYIHLLKPNIDNWIGYAEGYIHLLKPNTDNWIGLSLYISYSIICVRLK
jgi:hypothetical protein